MTPAQVSRAEAILRDLIAEPPLEQHAHGFLCILCSASCWTPADHVEDCPWRLAYELVTELLGVDT